MLTTKTTNNFMSNSELSLLTDEIFCLKYELQLVGSQLSGAGLERWIEGYSPQCVHNEHKQRYTFVSDFTKDKTVLDIACGTGRGSRIIAEAGEAKQVFGFDIDVDTVRYASIRNNRPSITFQQGDAQTCALPYGCEVAVCFETIEHLCDPAFFLARLSQVLAPNGLLFISTPLSRLDVDNNPANKFHTKEWGVEAFRILIEDSFTIRSHYLQYYPYKPVPRIKRILKKLRGSNYQSTSDRDALPLWEEYSNGPVPGFSVAYQILECQTRHNGQ